jgi:uncharacterized protein (DUF433 family)
MMTSMEMSLEEERLAFTRRRVAELAGVDLETIDRWDRLNLVGASERARLSEGKQVRLYRWADLLEVLIIADLLARPGVSGRYVRQIVSHVRAREYRMGELHWAIAGSRVHFRAPDGQWEDGERSQFVATEVLDLKPLRDRIRRGAERAEEGTSGQIEKRRGALGSKPVIAGTRVPVATIERYLAHGFSVERILVSFPTLTAADIETVRQLAS